MYLALFIGLVTVGVLLLALGVRGRRMGDHPFCRQCGFDLFGRPADSTQCPECGRELAARKAIIVGVRRWRRGPAWAGVALLVPTLAIGGAIGIGRARGVDWQKHKPAWWLTREATGTVAASRDAALKELLLRLKAGQLSDSRVRLLVAAGMRHQADASATWIWRWGEIIEAARRTGQVADGQWQAYLDESIRNYQTLVIRPRLRNTDPPAYVLRVNGARLARSGKWYYGMRVRSMTIDGQSVPHYGGGGGGTIMTWPGAIHTGYLDDKKAAPLMKSLAPGPHAGELRVDMCLFEFAQPVAATRPTMTRTPRVAMPSYSSIYQNLLDSEGPAPAGTVIARNTFPFRFEIVGPEIEIMDWIRDPAMRQSVADSLVVKQATLTGSIVHVTIDSPRPACDMSFKVFAKVDGEEVYAGHLALIPGSGRYNAREFHGSVHRDPAAPPVDKIDVILRPDSTAAARRPDIVRAWGEEVVLRDVPLRNVPVPPSRRLVPVRKVIPTTTTTHPTSSHHYRFEPAPAPTR